MTQPEGSRKASKPRSPLTSTPLTVPGTRSTWEPPNLSRAARRTERRLVFLRFYLFYHLLTPSHNFPNPEISRQIWLTTEKPRILVEKYGEYAHGKPRTERRVVLDKDMLTEIEDGNRLRVVPRMDLLERFVATLREQSRLAADEKEPLPVLIFSHGNEDTYGTQMGVARPDSALMLQVLDVHKAIDSRADVTLLLTSCYSAGWTIKPINAGRPLNVTAITATDEENESLSWAKTASIGRATGSTVASAILNSLVSTEAAAATSEDSEIATHPTYIKFASTIWAL
ncbi:hypothetical protein AJ79_04755 [Helicocarpus griseus UAMH5409]|uniref:Peptidase C13 family protein n=1 Tax=Helicocarpus griseus UAMH5409 TaxID=1447875 RepID=A0A2B7XRN9_9EURO|nr:hypothetical protein AJ79_04755 [Helicocarpus griseus UAMH5409]